MRRGLLLALLLAACGAPPASEDPRDTLTRAALDSVGAPLILAILPDGPGGRTLYSSLNLVATNGDVTTWETPDDITVSFRDGVLVGTRGLGDDTMTADVAGSIAASRGQGGAGLYERFHGTLDGGPEIAYRSFQCRVSARAPETITIVERAHATMRTEETCVSPGLTVRNAYWRGTDGVMWKSRQWVGTVTGYLETERLVR